MSLDIDAELIESKKITMFESIAYMNKIYDNIYL